MDSCPLRTLCLINNRSGQTRHFVFSSYSKGLHLWSLSDGQIFVCGCPLQRRLAFGSSGLFFWAEVGWRGSSSGSRPIRLGYSVCIAHTCRWGALADAQGLHGLVCKQAPSKTARHQAINDVTARAVTSAGIPVTKEPVGLTRLDGKRPDGLTLIPWQGGKSLTWDVTVVSTLADSYLHASSHSAGGAAEIASVRKESKYSLLPSDYIFQPVAFETLGSLNSSDYDFLCKVDQRLSAVSGDLGETSFLFRRLSILLQRFNSVLFNESFSSNDEDLDL